MHIDLEKILTLFSIPLFLLAGCEEAPSPAGNGGGGGNNVELVPKEVTLHSKFTEDFSDKASEFFNYNYRASRDDFRYFPGVPSLSERDTEIMMLCVDPADAAGAARGSEILSKEHTFYGTYSVRIRVPDIRMVQPDAAVIAGFSAYGTDESFGLGEIYFEWIIADPALVYVGTRTGPETVPNEVGITLEMTDKVKDFDASRQFYTYGFDWRPESIAWWILNPSNNEKAVLWEYKGTENFPGHPSATGIPVIPVRCKLNVWHSKIKPAAGIPTSIEAPSYPYEFEIDRMSYEPYDEMNDSWLQEHFN